MSQPYGGSRESGGQDDTAATPYQQQSHNDNHTTKVPFQRELWKVSYATTTSYHHGRRCPAIQEESPSDWLTTIHGGDEDNLDDDDDAASSSSSNSFASIHPVLPFREDLDEVEQLLRLREHHDQVRLRRDLCLAETQLSCPSATPTTSSGFHAPSSSPAALQRHRLWSLSLLVTEAARYQRHSNHPSNDRNDGVVDVALPSPPPVHLHLRELDLGVKPTSSSTTTAFGGDVVNADVYTAEGYLNLSNPHVLRSTLTELRIIMGTGGNRSAPHTTTCSSSRSTESTVPPPGSDFLICDQRTELHRQTQDLPLVVFSVLNEFEDDECRYQQIKSHLDQLGLWAQQQQQQQH